MCALHTYNHFIAAWNIHLNVHMHRISTEAWKRKKKPAQTESIILNKRNRISIPYCWMSTNNLWASKRARALALSTKTFCGYKPSSSENVFMCVWVKNLFGIFRLWFRELLHSGPFIIDAYARLGRKFKFNDSTNYYSPPFGVPPPRYKKKNEKQHNNKTGKYLTIKSTQTKFA